MAVAPGDSVGSFKILSPLGRGGMGEVFRARDSRLGRDVALKFLRVDWATDPQARDRLEREARAIGALSHPNIGSLYDLGEHDGSPFLVMECVDGETLADRLARGPLPLTEVVRIGTSIAEALAFAHRHGIVHRDLKPANVMLTKAGVKLLDFGLAKVTRAEDGEAATALQTEPHALLGTLPYMAPEQLTGGVVDARSDVFAFGCVLFEMVSGRRLFDRPSGAEITSAILRDDPPPVDPLTLNRIVQRCLSKDPDDRWQSIQDVAVQLGWVLSTVDHARRPPSWWIPIGGVAALVMAVALVAWPGDMFHQSGAFDSSTAKSPETSFASITLGRGQRFVVNSRPNLAISRDGRMVAFNVREDSTQQLFVRRLDQPVPLRVATNSILPFFSPDGRWIGFESDGKLRKVSTSGGQVVPLADVSEMFGAVWTDTGDIVFAPASAGGLWLVSAGGGAPRQVTTLDDSAHEVSHRWPFLMPDGRIAFVANSSATSSLSLIDLRSGRREPLLDSAAWGTFLPSGRLLFSRRRQLLWVDAADVGRLAEATPVPVAEVPLMNGTGVPFLAVSSAGHMIFLPAEVDEGQRTLVWVDSTGRSTPLPAPPRAFQYPSIAPDGRRAAVSIRNGSDTNAWLYDLARQALTPLTADGKSSGTFAWSPDSRELMFSSMATGPRNIRRLQIDAPGIAHAVTTGTRSQWPLSWLANGRLVFMQFSPETQGDILELTLADGRMAPLVTRPSTEWGGRVSADGQWLAYVTNESGRFEVRVSRLSQPDRFWQVSLGGGQEVAWSRKGLELYYRTDTAMMAASIIPNADPPVGAVRRLFDSRHLFEPSGPGLPNYDVAPDGRFLMIATDDDPAALSLRVVFNWSVAVPQPVSRVTNQ